ncbi:MAG: rhodanese-like domain-containing protein [Deltaproteobacteria bacterium]|nr:rhodanese-like domain-containing protein [Deltaproteobacteria bacterium]
MKRETKLNRTWLSCLWALVFWFMATPAAALDIPSISPAEVKKMIEAKGTDFLVVDVQPKEVYDEGHVKGAVSFPWETELKNSGNLPRDKMLILYCDCAHEEDSIDTATQLIEKFGYKNVKLLEGGWSKWQQLGYPVDKK